MKTLRCVMPRAGEVDLQTVDVPEPGAGELRVRTVFSLISPGTELAMFNGTHIGLPNPNNLFAKYPFAPGYAAIGEVEASQDERFAPGTQVYFQGKHQGIQVLNPARQLVLPLPAGIEPTHAPFARLAQIANTALFVSDGAPQEGAVVVVGLGLVGNFAAQLYQRAGATVFAFDTLAARCEWGVRSGLERSIQVTGDLVETITQAVGGKAALAIEATGVGALAISCLQVVRDRGVVVLLGSPRDKVSIDTYDLIHRSGARLVGAHERLVPVFAEHGLDQHAVSREMLGAIAQGSIKVQPLVSDIIAPADLAQTYRALESRKDQVLGVLLDWHKA